MVGHSWGAWLSFITTARYPAEVKKLVLIGSGPFEQQYAMGIIGTRLTRLSEADRLRVLYLIEALSNPDTVSKNRLFEEFGALFARADAYDPLPDDNEVLDNNTSAVEVNIQAVVPLSTRFPSPAKSRIGTKQTAVPTTNFQYFELRRRIQLLIDNS